jgi:hypothetical protein
MRRLGLLNAALALIAAAMLSSCASTVGAILVGMAFDELSGVETSKIDFTNVAGVLYLQEGEQFYLQVLHRQLLDSSYGRDYYEEFVTEECKFYSSDSSVAVVEADGLVFAKGKGTATITAVFKLALQKADQARLTVVVE